MGITQNVVRDSKIMVVIVMVTIAVCDGDNCGDIQPIIETTENKMTNKTQTYVKKSHLMLNTNGQLKGKPR